MFSLARLFLISTFLLTWFYPHFAEGSGVSLSIGVNIQPEPLLHDPPLSGSIHDSGHINSKADQITSFRLEDRCNAEDFLKSPRTIAVLLDRAPFPSSPSGSIRLPAPFKPDRLLYSPWKSPSDGSQRTLPVASIMPFCSARRLALCELTRFLRYFMENHHIKLQIAECAIYESNTPVMDEFVILAPGDGYQRGQDPIELLKHELAKWNREMYSHVSLVIPEAACLGCRWQFISATRVATTPESHHPSSESVRVGHSSQHFHYKIQLFFLHPRHGIPHSERN